MKRQPNKVVRTVKNGAVTIMGRVYRAIDQGLPAIPYDGRLDGKRVWFGLYRYGEELQGFVYCGTVERTHEHLNHVTLPDGNTYVAWMFWYTDDELKRRAALMEANEQADTLASMTPCPKCGGVGVAGSPPYISDCDYCGGYGYTETA